MCILDLSKAFMFAFHHDKIVSKYEARAKLLMTGTDSLVYSIETADIYADMMADADAYDMSDYSSDHPAYSAVNKKVLGKMKDEYNGRMVAEFVECVPNYTRLSKQTVERKRKQKESTNVLLQKCEILPTYELCLTSALSE